MQVFFPCALDTRCTYQFSHSIMQKLQELGWEDELKGHPRHYQGLYQLSYVKQAKDLTERGESSHRNNHSQP